MKNEEEDKKEGGKQMRGEENPSQWCAGSCGASKAIVFEDEGQFISQAQLAA